MRTLKIILALAASAAFIACGAPATTQQAEVPAAQSTAPPPAQTPPPAPAQEAASAPQPSTQRPAAAAPKSPPPPASTARQHTPPPGSASAPAPTATAYRAPEPPKPQMIEVPAGTVLEMELVDPLSSTTNVVGDTFKATVSDAVEVGGLEVIPAGSVVEGTVTEAVSAKKLSGQASLSMEFNRLVLPDGHSVVISAMLTQKGKKISSRTGAVVGGSAAGGAVLGKIFGKSTKGALVGAALGAAVGTGVAASQKGQELKLPAGAGLSVEIQNPVQVPVAPRRS